MRDPDRVFRDVMRYMEAKIPSPQTFESQADLQRYLEDADQQLSGAKGEDRRISQFALQEMISSGAAKNRVNRQAGKKQQLTTLQRQALHAEIQRKQTTRQIDESRTSKQVLKVNQETFKKWKKNPNRFDLKGIDTKTHSFIKGFIRDRSNKWKKQNLRVINDRDITAFVVRKDKRGRPYAFNIINGQRVPKTTYQKFGTLQSLTKRGKQK